MLYSTIQPIECEVADRSVALPELCKYHDNIDSLLQTGGGCLTRERQNSLFDRLDWFADMARHCLPGSKPAIVEAHSGTAEAWLLMRQDGFGRAAPLANYYNFTFRPVFGGDYDEVTRLRLIAMIAAQLKPHAHQISMSPVPDEDDSASLLERGFVQAGWYVIREHADENHILQVRGRTFDQYWQERPGQLRSTVRRKSAKNIVSLRIESEFVNESWADYEAVYAASWKPAEGVPAFLQSVAQREAKAGALRLGLAYVDGKPVAAQFWTVENGEALIHKLAHVEDAVAASPGTLLSAAMFQHVIDVDGVRIIDFGTGNDAYKRDWMEEVRPRYRLKMYWPNHPLNWPYIARDMYRKYQQSKKGMNSE